MERTLVFVKPDGVQRRLIGRIVARFEDKGLRIVGMKMMRVDAALAERHYAEHKGKPFYAGLLKFVTAGPIVAMVLEGNDVVRIARQMLGKTFGLEAEPGTIRGDFGAARTYNLVHGSDSPESARREIALYFRPEEILDYARSGDEWNFDAAKE
ncbi:MAG: Nucleoside diphosphate kinase [Phycisphaerae bacterium]|nr:Nucleoside diphosphate kinase [Phycisphaerae bacterium]